MRSPFQKEFYVVGYELPDVCIELYGNLSAIPQEEKMYLKFNDASNVKKMLTDRRLLPKGSKTVWQVYRVKIEEA